MPRIQKIFVEYGLDFDNNRFGLGRSAEIEYTDGTERRTHDRIRPTTITSRYIRIWIGRRVLVMDTARPHVAWRRKGRLNFKIVFGLCGL